MRLGWGIFAATFALSCDARRSEPPRPRAEFGVFFGGQIQERDELPFELDTGKQTQGFRVELQEPAERDTPLQWDVSMPGKRDSRKQGDRAARPQAGTGVIVAGERRFEQALRFRPGDPLGLWNIRVVMGNRVLMDRPFTVYDAAARARIPRADAGWAPKQ